jgi:hypothetical protein
MAHDQEVVGSNPSTIYWMDVSDATSYYIQENNENKGSRMGHTKKNILKKSNLQFMVSFLKKTLFKCSLKKIVYNFFKKTLAREYKYQ